MNARRQTELTNRLARLDNAADFLLARIIDADRMGPFGRSIVADLIDRLAANRIDRNGVAVKLLAATADAPAWMIV